MTSAPRRDAVLAFLIWAGYLLTVGWVPRWFPPDPSLPNVAAQLGYNVRVAYFAFILWTLAAVLVAAIVSGRSPSQDIAVQPAVPPPSRRERLLRYAELAVAGGYALKLYFPWALVRLGPHVEDTYFRTVLYRMACGEKPYVDFEFLYSPLMLAMPWAWMKVFSVSPVGYYSFFAATQVGFYVTLVAILQRYIPKRLPRLFAFFVFLPFVFDILLGLNWIAWRYFGAVLVIFLLASRSRSRLRLAMACFIAGVQGMYSYEYGIAGLVSGLVIFLVQLFEGRRKEVGGSALLFLGGSLAVYGLGVTALTSAQPLPYFASAAHALKVAGDLGLGQFALTWTPHSAALFLILACGIVAAGYGLRNLTTRPASAGDLQLVGALTFLGIAMKAGLQRADYMHLAVPFVPLILVLLLRLPRALATSSISQRAIFLSAALVASVAHAIGHIPIGQHVVGGSEVGLMHVRYNRPTVGPFNARGDAWHQYRSFREENKIWVADRLAQADTRNRPVIFYGPLWDDAPEVGVCPQGYAFYDLLYSNDLAPLSQIPQRHPDTIVVIRAKEYSQLLAATPLETATASLTPERQLASWVSSVHFTQSPMESGVEFAMWKKALGDYLVAHAQVLDRREGVLLLEMKR